METSIEPKNDCNLPNVKAYVINLSRQKDKWKECQKRLEEVELNYERFEAIDGCDLEWGEELQKYFILHEDNYSYIPYKGNVGIFGCAMSHVRLWEKFSKFPDDTICMITEDDVYFGNNFKDDFNNVYSYLRGDENWDICYLGYTFFRETLLETDIKVNERLYKLVKSNKRNNCGGTFCYLLRAKGAKRLLDIVKTKKIHRAIDWFLIDYYDQINAYICNPLIVEHKTPFTAVQGAQKTLKGLPPPFEFLDKFVYINSKNTTDEIKRKFNKFSQNKLLIFKTSDSFSKQVERYTSHIEVVKMAINNNWSSYLVTEDDMLWVDFDNGYNRFLKLPEQRDIVVLGTQFFKIQGETRLAKGKGSSTFIVYKHYYKILLENMEEGLKKLQQNHTSFTLDLHLNILQERDNWLIIDPPLCIHVSND